MADQAGIPMLNHLAKKLIQMHLFWLPRATPLHLQSHYES